MCDIMKINWIFILSIFFLVVFTLGTASASDENITQNLSVCNVEIDNFQDSIVESNNESLDKIFSKQESIYLSQEDNGKLKEDVNSKEHILGRSSDIYVYAPKKFVLGQDSLHIDLPYDAKGIVNIYVDSKLFKKVPSNDFFRDWDVSGDGETMYQVECSVSTNLLGISSGRHTIKIVWRGDSKYGTKSQITTIDASYLLSAEISKEFIYGYGVTEDGSKLRINMPCDIKKKPVIKIDGKSFKKFKKIKWNEYVSSFELDISKLSKGTHTLKVTYKEGKKYPSKSISKKFKVNYGIFSNAYDSSIYIDCINYGAGHKFGLKLPSNAKGKFVVYISKKESSKGKLFKEVSLKKGSASISLDDLEPYMLPNHFYGHYYCHFEYTGNDYKVKSETRDVIMQKNFICPESMDYGQDRYLIIKSHKNDTSQLEINYMNIDGVEKVINYTDVKLVNGVGKVSLKNLPIGYINLGINEGDIAVDNFFIVVKALTGTKNINMFYGDGNVYSVKVFDKLGNISGKGKTVKFVIDGKTYKRSTDDKGIASLKITNKPGKYKITAYIDDDGYNDEWEETSNVIVVNHLLKLNNVKVKRSAKKIVLKATLMQKKVFKSKNIIFTFNGKKYNAKINNKGVAKVTIKSNVLKKLKVGKKIKYEVSYGGDTVKKTVIVGK